MYETTENSRRRKKFRILSISGGGSRGIIPVIVLMRLEQLTGRHVTELFDLSIGTSTGAMITAALNVPRKMDDTDAADDDDAVKQSIETDSSVVRVDNGNLNPRRKWKYTAQDLVDIYLKEAPLVFEKSLLKQWYTINGIYGHLYDTKKRDERFEVWMGTTCLRETLSDIVLTSYERCEETPVFFKSRKAKLNESCDFLLSDCVKASTAAPTVWPYHQICDNLYMDALYAKNPSMFGIFEAHRYYGIAYEDMILVSLGTGYVKNRVEAKDVLMSGIGFYKDAFNSVINANTKCVTHMVKSLVQTLEIDVSLPEQHMGITDVDKNHMNYMIKVTEDYLKEYDEQIREFARLLVPQGESADGNVD
jgi:uncharacterized protein